MWAAKPGSDMSSFASSRQADETDVRRNLCDETPFRNDCGPSRPLSCELPERPLLETAPFWDRDLPGGEFGTNADEFPLGAKPQALKRRWTSSECRVDMVPMSTKVDSQSATCRLSMDSMSTTCRLSCLVGEANDVATCLSSGGLLSCNARPGLES